MGPALLPPSCSPATVTHSSRRIIRAWAIAGTTSLLHCRFDRPRRGGHDRGESTRQRCARQAGIPFRFFRRWLGEPRGAARSGEQGQHVLGSAQVAGAYDLRRVSLPAALKGGAPSHSLYLAYAAWGRPLTTATRWIACSRPSTRRPLSVCSLALGRRKSSARCRRIRALCSTRPSSTPSIATTAHWYLDSFAANSLVESRLARLFGSTTDRRISTSCRRKRWLPRVRCAPESRRQAIDVGAVGHDRRCWPRRR